MPIPPDDLHSQPGLFGQLDLPVPHRQEQGVAAPAPARSPAPSNKAGAADEMRPAEPADAVPVRRKRRKAGCESASARTISSEKSASSENTSGIATLQPPSQMLADLPERYFTVRQVATRYRVGIATVWRWVKEQDGFPEPVRLSKGTTRWCEADLLRFEIARRAGK